MTGGGDFQLILEALFAQRAQKPFSSCQDLLDGCQKGLSTFQDWLETLRHGRLRFLLNSAKVKAQWESKLTGHANVRDELAAPNHARICYESGLSCSFGSDEGKCRVCAQGCSHEWFVRSGYTVSCFILIFLVVLVIPCFLRSTASFAYSKWL